MVKGLEDFNGRLQGIIKLISVGLGILARAQVSITLKLLLHLLDAFHFVSLFRPLWMLERPKALRMLDHLHWLPCYWVGEFLSHLMELHFNGSESSDHSSFTTYRLPRKENSGLWWAVLKSIWRATSLIYHCILSLVMNMNINIYSKYVHISSIKTGLAP